MSIKNTIKNVKPTKNSRFKQGYFPVNESTKYIGSGPVIYRSSWEQKFCHYCERTPSVINWTSESIGIKYFSQLDNKYHTYYPDFLLKMNDNKIILVEIKPKAQLKEPKVPKRKTKKAIENYNYSLKMWINLKQKEAAALEYVKMRGWEYMYVTEDFFN